MNERKSLWVFQAVKLFSTFNKYQKPVIQKIYHASKAPKKSLNLSGLSKRSNAVSVETVEAATEKFTNKFVPVPDGMSNKIAYKGRYLDEYHYFDYKDSKIEDVTMCGEPEYESEELKPWRKKEEG